MYLALIGLVALVSILEAKLVHKERQYSQSCSH